MSDFRKGDVCSLEVEYLRPDDGNNAWVSIGHGQEMYVGSADITLIRRAPVDLATCDLPKDVWDSNRNHAVTLLARHEHFGWVQKGDGRRYDALLSDLRPADAPAPAAGQTFDVRAYVEGYEYCADIGIYRPAEAERAMLEDFGHGLLAEFSRGLIPKAQAPAPAAEAGEVERLRAALVNIAAGCHPKGDAATEDYYLRRIEGIAKEALASTASSCPPGHVLIKGHVVPEPMREGV